MVYKYQKKVVDTGSLLVQFTNVCLVPYNRSLLYNRTSRLDIDIPDKSLRGLLINGVEEPYWVNS